MQLKRWALRYMGHFYVIYKVYFTSRIIVCVSVVSGVLVKCFLLEALCSTLMGLLIFENLLCNLSDVSVCEAYLSAQILFLAHPT